MAAGLGNVLFVGSLLWAAGFWGSLWSALARPQSRCLC